MNVLGLFSIGLVIFASSPAHAEISGQLELKSDDRYRGRSLTRGQPVIDADISVDTTSGIYAGGSATLILDGDNGIGLQGVESYIGYAKKVDNDVTIDLGFANYVFTRRYSGAEKLVYAEIYAGVNSGNFSAYLHYTPNYFDMSVPVVYADLTLTQPLGSDFLLKAHAGLLTQTSGPPRRGGKDTRYDTRLAFSRPILGLEAEVAWTFGGPNDRYFDGPWDGNSAFIFSLSKHF